MTKEIKEQSKLTQEEWNEFFAGHWNFPGERQDKHLAMFPEELPRRLIQMFSFVGDTVLDPFLGSGTTSLAAKNLERNSIGYEINKDFLPLILEKVGAKQGVIFNDATFQIIEREMIDANFQREIERLPYVFKDPVKFDKKIDPKKLRFGSKIDNSPTERENYYNLREIISPETLVLSNGLKIRLLGIKEKQETKQGAINYLREKTRGQKVFIKFDNNVKYDEKNSLLCYLYLWNKTFLNAHLIKNGLVDVDTTLDYRYKLKFLGYLRTMEERKVEGKKQHLYEKADLLQTIGEK